MAVQVANSYSIDMNVTSSTIGISFSIERGKYISGGVSVTDLVPTVVADSHKYVVYDEAGNIKFNPKPE